MAASIVSGSLGGYSAEFLTAEQYERFTFMKNKLCGNKAVDVADHEKNGMHSIVAAMNRMQWTEISTFLEVSYPDLVKAFYVCLRSEADGSLTSSVKGVQIKIDHELLKTLFSVSTSGHSGIHFVDTQTKGLGIVGPGFRFRYDVLGNSEPGAIVEKMGQAIRSRNLRKSGFSIVNGVWSKTFVAEDEAIIGEAQAVQQEVVADIAEPATVAIEASEPEVVASEVPSVIAVVAEAPKGAIVEEFGRRIVGSISEEPLPSSLVASVLRDVPDSIQSTPVIPEGDGSSVEEAVASGHFKESVSEDAPSQGERIVSGPQISDSVAVGHTVEEVMIEAPIQKEQTSVQEDVVLEDALIEGEHSVSEEIQEEIGVPVNERSDADHANFEEPVGRASKRKRIALKRLRKIEKKASTSKEISQIRNVMKWFNKEMGTMKTMLSEILKTDVPRPSGPSEADVPRPLEPSEQEAGPPGPAEAVPPAEISEQEPSQTRQQVEEVELVGLSKPQAVQVEPAGPVISKDVQSGVEEPAVAPEAPEPSFLATPAPSSPPSSSKAPQAPPTFKQPMPRTISSPTPFPSQSPFFPTSSPNIPPPPTVIANPPASSSARASSSSGHSFTRPSSTITPRSFIHPPTPPSSITFIPENPQLASSFFTQVEDEFESSTTTSVLTISSVIVLTLKEDLVISRVVVFPSFRRRTWWVPGCCSSSGCEEKTS
ncbi:hypothetical protein Taro_026418 [Colocasia esculenta]|uniref:Uncharacterized protein n=1 Tax=Colocasia esculenta TaxID=4460 RepID=A0A843VR92_COLES|nr:hypothetical protein [Colocasia esculenta]